MKYYKTISAYCEAIQIPPPKYPQFDIRSFEENMPTVVSQMPPFRHNFYAIAMKVEGKGKVITGHHADFPEGTVIFFNSPFQILSWDIAPDWEGYYLMFSQDFIAQSFHFNNLLDQFPFLKIDKAMPFKVGKEEVGTLLAVYEKIYEAYHSTDADKFDFIEVYTLLLLNYVKRYFHQQVHPLEAEKAIRSADVKLLSRYKSLIETQFRPDTSLVKAKRLHSTRYYAEYLNVHPNHLNAVVKGLTGQTALHFIHQHMLQLAKAQLVQTALSVKEIAYNLHFDSPNNFSSFFKKQTQQTPLAYRKKADVRQP